MPEDQTPAAPANAPLVAPGTSSGRVRPHIGTDDPLLAIDPELFEEGPARDWATRRYRRMMRWRRPLTRRRDRVRAWLNMLFVDHGVIRLIYANMWQVTPLMWRSAQPAPHHIRRFARAGGRTVVTLRGGLMFGSLPLETEACAANGLDFRTIVLRSRALPTPDEMRAILAELDRIETPVLFHCKSGADRAGFMGGLWLLHREGADAARALDQLSLRYGHIRRSRTGILDAFFLAFARDGEAQGLTLAQWIETAYDPEAIASDFRATGLGTLIGDRLLARE
jgi:protein tyrosine phosphatase (PTP) superfamily phosphohydrolase (DUF442 family)